MFDYYRAKVKNALIVRMQYPGNFFVWAFAGIIQPLILLTVWNTVTRANSGVVGGFASGDFSAYFIGVLFVQSATFTWIFWEFEYRIRNGTFSPLLLLPIHPIHSDVAENVAYKIMSLSALIPASILLAVLFPPRWHSSLQDLLLFIPALLLAAVLRFLFEWTLALAAFWLVKVTALNQLYHASAQLFSGQIAPLVLFPEVLQQLAGVLPFRYYVSFPVEILLGRLSPEQVANGFLVQIGWLLAAYLTFRIIWRISMRRHTAVGA